MCVTQSAISHQVKLLEEFLGAPLFIRRPQRVELTLRGSEYLEMVSHLMDELETATRKIKSERIAGPLNVQASAAFATYWLLPRILRFNRIYPEVELNLSTIGHVETPGSHAFDVRVNCSWEVPPGPDSEPFMTSTRVPVCSPELLKRGPPISKPVDILSYPILREEGSWDKWDQWFDLAGIGETRESTDPRLGDAYLAIKAAEEGQGIALGTTTLITEKVTLGRLIVLFELETQPKLYYTITYAKNWKRRPKIVAFRDWLYAEIGSYTELDPSSGKHSAVVR